MARTVSGELLGSTAGVIFGPGRTLLHTETTIEVSRQQSCETMLRTSALLGDSVLRLVFFPDEQVGTKSKGGGGGGGGRRIEA